VKIFIPSDMEGTAGVVDWEQCRPGQHDYEYYRDLLQAEVNATIEGALEAGGPHEFLVNDSFDAVFFVSYHGSMTGTPATLSHTYNPLAIAEVRLNGTVAGESGINAIPISRTWRRGWRGSSRIPRTRPSCTSPTRTRSGSTARSSRWSC